jgi:hypothetical protein
MGIPLIFEKSVLPGSGEPDVSTATMALTLSGYFSAKLKVKLLP